MQDLLNEEEFITQKPYNPWKRFIVFYIIACLTTILSYLIGISFKDDSPVRTIIAYTDLFSPLVLFFMMFFYKWKFETSIFTNLLAIFIFSLIYVITIVTLNLINPADRIISEKQYIDMTIYISKFYLTYFIIFSAIIIPVTIYRN